MSRWESGSGVLFEIAAMIRPLYGLVMVRGGWVFRHLVAPLMSGRMRPVESAVKKTSGPN